MQHQFLRQRIALPLASHPWLFLEASFPITNASWDQMLAILEAMKPALVQDEQPAPVVE